MFIAYHFGSVGEGKEMLKGQTASHTNEFALRVLVAWNQISLKPVNSLQSYLYIQCLTIVW